jgi:hypothetical protein
VFIGAKAGSLTVVCRTTSSKKISNDWHNRRT